MSQVHVAHFGKRFVCFRILTFSASKSLGEHAVFRTIRESHNPVLSFVHTVLSVGSEQELADILFPARKTR
jgi:hypothetical protein